MTNNFVPFQPERQPGRSDHAERGKDDAILYGATSPDKGGLPLGTLEYLTFSRFYNAPGTPVHSDAEREGPARARFPARHGDAQRSRRGWTVDAAKPRARRRCRAARA
jgi:hypothetical protein